MSTELETIAAAVAKMMATANGESPPDVQTIDGATLAAQSALSGTVAQFTVGTPFGFEARVTIARAAGMFGEETRP